MTRVIPREVRTVMGELDSSITDEDIEFFITMANNVVDANLLDKLPETQLRTIETFLTAHLLSISRQPQFVRRRVMDAEDSILGSFGDGLKSTTFGQQVLILDNTGNLASLGVRKALFRVL